MLLSEKLSELRYNILRDKAIPPLWDDDALLRYIKDAERRFARRSLVLRDSTTSEYTQIKLKTGVVTYPLHKLVLGVLSGRYDTDDYDLQRIGHSVLSLTAAPEFLEFDPNTTYAIRPGRPVAIYSDETLVYAKKNSVTISIYPTPSVNEDGKTVRLRVFRLPNTEYSVDALEIEGEIPEDYELDALSWAAYRALRNNETEGINVSAAESHKTEFEAAISSALKETRRKLFAPIQVKYGTTGLAYVR